MAVERASSAWPCAALPDLHTSTNTNKRKRGNHVSRMDVLPDELALGADVVSGVGGWDVGRELVGVVAVARGASAHDVVLAVLAAAPRVPHRRLVRALNALAAHLVHAPALPQGRADAAISDEPHT